MNKRMLPSWPRSAVPLLAAGFMLMVAVRGITGGGVAGASPEPGQRTAVEKPPLRLDPYVQTWRTQTKLEFDRILKTRNTALSEARRIRQLEQERRIVAEAKAAANILPSKTIATTPLRLNSTDPGSGEPGDYIRFRLNQPPSATGGSYEAHFIVAPGRDERAEAWTTYSSQDGGTVVVARIPTGIWGIAAPYNGLAYLIVNGRATNSIAFTFKPSYEVMALYMTRLEWLDNCRLEGYGWFDSGYDATVCKTGIVAAISALGGKGDDEFWRTFTLKNGWVTDHFEVKAQPAANYYKPYGCSVVSSRIGTSSPYVKIHWWYEGGGAPFIYTLWIFIKGPVGVSYK